VRLTQRNRLAALADELTAAKEKLDKARTGMDEAEENFQTRQKNEGAARSAMQMAFAALNEARDNYTKLAEASAATNSKLAALEEALEHLDHDMAALAKRAADTQDELQALTDTEAMRAELNTRRTELAEKRQVQALRQSEFDQIQREQTTLMQRRVAGAADIANWQQRADASVRQMETLTARMSELEAGIAELRERPATLSARRDTLLTESTEAEAKRSAAADKLIAAENHLNGIEQQLKRDEAALSEGRENRVRAEAAVQSAEDHINDLRERIAEKLDCAPEETAAIAEFKEGEPLPAASELDQQLARFLRERDNMGPVNLRAEVESDAVQNEIDRLQNEKNDLVAAIAKLRQGIGQLNREARERLQEAFTKVDERFRKLFTRLFNGGRAHLELIDDEDPLNAGLEIFASPPGKKLQVLSLLSGGERSLTALALLFAVFQTNPSPICVLDEAEAALDESNVDRFCNLVSDIARETGTRFLVITHQRLTMARMDRLFGVTMSEKGVSQLVSVDLAQAEAIRDGEIPQNVTLAAAE